MQTGKQRIRVLDIILGNCTKNFFRKVAGFPSSRQERFFPFLSFYKSKSSAKPVLLALVCICMLVVEYLQYLCGVLVMICNDLSCSVERFRSGNFERFVFCRSLSQITLLEATMKQKYNIVLWRIFWPQTCERLQQSARKREIRSRSRSWI